MIIIDKETGLEYSLCGVDKSWSTHYISQDGNIVLIGEGNTLVGEGNRVGKEITQLRLIRPRHTFGGVMFEETGEKRIAKAGDYSLLGNECLTYWNYDDSGIAWSVILKPVALEE